MEKRLDRLEHKVFGNGEPGMDEVLRANTAAIGRLDRKLDALRDSVEGLRQERRDDLKKREGRAETLKWADWLVRFIAAAVLIGGSLGLWSIRSQNEQVLQQLRNMPSLPE
jgi:hypothetical protein